MWVTILSDHLPVTALVSRYLTNKLMGREPIFERKTLVSPTCEGGPHPVLFPVSGGYPRFEGRLLTCYSPFRHFPLSEESFTFDLHA